MASAGPYASLHCAPLCFLQAGCPSCCPTNSVKTLKALWSTENKASIDWLIDWLHVVQSKSLSCNSFRRQFCLLLKVFRVGRRDGKRAQHEAESETAASAADDEGGVVSIFLWEDLLQRRLKLTFCGWNHSYRGWFALNATSGHTEFISSDIVVSFNRICCDEIAFLVFGSLDENCSWKLSVCCCCWSCNRRSIWPAKTCFNHRIWLVPVHPRLTLQNESQLNNERK